MIPCGTRTQGASGEEGHWTTGEEGGADLLIKKRNNKQQSLGLIW